MALILSMARKRGRGRNYSLIRRIGSSLPDWLIPRHKITLPLTIPHVRSGDSLDEDNMLVMVTFEGEMSYNDYREDDDCGEEEEMERSSMNVATPVKLKSNPEDCSSFLSLPPDVIRDAHSVRRSPSPSRRETAAIARISELEEQLSSLRSQIAQIVAKQEGIHVVQAQGAPPPPPPPPPPPAPPLPPSLTPSKDVASLIRERREQRKRGDGASPSATRPPGRPDMREVLRGIGNVKLKPVARGPDGTPLRVSPLKQALPNDPAAIVAMALRHRFAKTRPMLADSPPQEHNESGWSDDENSPYTSPFIGRHLLRKVRGPNLPTRIRQSWGEEMGASECEENQ